MWLQGLIPVTFISSLMAMLFPLSYAATVLPSPVGDATHLPMPVWDSKIALSNLKVGEDGRVMIEPENPDALTPLATNRLTQLGENIAVMCGSYLMAAGQSVRITSPEHPDDYPNKFNCRWNFMTSDDQELSFTCTAFDLAKGDFLSVKHNADDPKKHRFGKAPSVASTDGGELNLYFKTNKAETSTGFDCTVTHLGGDSSTTSAPTYDSSTTETSETGRECGRVGTRIVNGEVTEPNIYPWQVFLQIIWSDGRVYNCGGSIIHNSWILTAAHCVVRSDESLTASVKVSVGAHDKYDPELQVLSEEIYIHPVNKITHDVAVIKLQSEVSYSATVGPVCLPPSSWESDDFVDTTLTMSGWGKTGDSESTSQLLRHVDTVGYSHSRCQSYYGSWLLKTILCTDGSMRKHVCSGDSGGPVTLKAEDDRRVQVGVISFVTSAGCATTAPDGHVRVAAFMSWIEETTGLTFS